MPNPFDQFDNVAPAPAAAAAPNPFDQFDVAPAVAQGAPMPAVTPPKEAPSTTLDVLQSFISGIPRGLSETAMLPVTASRALDKYATPYELDYVVNPVRGLFGAAPLTPEDVTGGTVQDTLAGAQDAFRSKREEYLHQPQTTAGQYAGTIGEFVQPGVLKTAAEQGLKATLGQFAREAVVPGITSETAGQITEGTAYEPAARIAGALAGNVTTSAIQAANTPESVLRKHVPENVDWDRALRLQDNSTGVKLTGVEAIDHATGGSSGLPDLLRLVEGGAEGRAVLGPFFSARQGQVDDAVGGLLDKIGPQSNVPSALGPTVADAAETALRQGPAGSALIDAIRGAGPRTTDLQAGEVIQPSLRGVYDDMAKTNITAAEDAARAVGVSEQALNDAIFGAGPRTTDLQAGEVIQPSLQSVYARREGMRNALGDADFEAARKAPPSIPVESLTPESGIKEPGYTRLDPNVDIHGRGEMAPTGVPPQYQTPSLTSNTGPDFIQVDARPALRAIDQLRVNEKGSAAGALSEVRDMLFSNGGLDTSVAGLQNARQGINGMINTAKQAGETHVVERLERAREALDAALETSPQVAAANRNFAAASEPLVPFEGNGLSKVISRDQFNKRFTMNPEDVPSALSSPSDLRTFGSVAAPEAMDALRNNLATKILDKATDANGNVSADRLSLALRDSEDMLAQVPDLKDRLTRVMESGRGVDNARSASETAAKVAAEPPAPFNGTGLGKIVARDEINQRFGLPAEKVPDVLSSPTEMKAFGAIAPGEAVDAARNNLATRILDSATDAKGNVSLDRLQAVIRDNEDLLNQLPGLREKLDEVVNGANILEGARATSPLGRISSARDTNAAMSEILPQNPTAGSAGEIGVTVDRLAAQNPEATSQLVRQAVADRYSQAAKDTQSGSHETAGIKFRNSLAGNEERDAVLRAILENLPDKAAAKAAPELLDVLHATGRRKGMGSPTAPLMELRQAASSGAPWSRLAEVVVSLGKRSVGVIDDTARRAAYGKTLGALADMFADPQSVQLIKEATERDVPSAIIDAIIRTTKQAPAAAHGGGRN